jgi:hypothetical protein
MKRVGTDDYLSVDDPFAFSVLNNIKMQQKRRNKV